MRRAAQARAYRSFANEMRHARKSVNKERRRKVYRASGKTAAWTARNGWSYRRLLAPLYVAAALQIAGVIAACEPGGARTVAACTVIGAALLCWADYRNRKNAGTARHDGSTRAAWPLFRRWYYAASYLAGAACLLVMANIGAGPPMPGVLGAGVFAAGIPWWWHNRSRTDPAVALDDRLLVWQTVVTAPNGVLPEGTDLLAVAPVTQADLDPDAGKTNSDPIGWSARVQLPAGKGTTAKIVAATADIAACYDLPVDAVIAEPTTDRSARSARLLVLDRHNPTYDTAIYDESWAVLVDGCYPTGVFPDGTRAWRRLYKPLNGPVHELYSGDSGSGKSRGMEAGITQSVMTGLVIPFVGDPQGGQSMPAWAGVAAQRIPEFGPEDLAALGEAFTTRYAPRTVEFEPASIEPESRPVAVPGARTIRARVLDYLTAHGQAHTGVVAAALDISKGTASKTLRRLEADGLVIGVRRGIWATPDSDIDDLEASA